MGRIRRHLSYANVVASIALFVALGGGAYAVVGNGSVSRHGVIKMCIQHPSHVPLVISPGGTCPSGSTPLTLNRKGPRGPRGPRGRTGSTTPPTYIDAYMALNRTVCGGCTYQFLSSTGGLGVQAESPGMSLEVDAATFDISTAGVYLVTVAVGPAGPVQLEVNGTRVGPPETSCAAATSMCTFQRILDLPDLGGSKVALVNATGSDQHEDEGSGITFLRIA